MLPIANRTQVGLNPTLTSKYALVVELVDTLVLEASAERCASSSLAWGTNFSSKMKVEHKLSRHTVDTDLCVDNIGNRFNLVLVAAQRARELKRGHRKLTTGSDGNIITALKEIEEGHVGPELLRRIR